MRYALLTAIICTVCVTAPAQDTALNNMARGMTYTLDPAPNYSYCSDPADATQLTDGVFTSDYF